MTASIQIDNILSQIKKLEEEEQLKLLSRMNLMIKKNKAATVKARRLSELAGLGGELWENLEDIDKYIEEERKW